MSERLDTGKSATAFRTIGEAADIIGVPQHVLRFWETRFPQLQPLKRGGNRRYYRPADMALLETIKRMLHDDGLTIRGAQQLLSSRRSGVEPAPVDAAPIAIRAAVSNGTADPLDRLRGARDRLRDALGEAASPA